MIEERSSTQNVSESSTTVTLFNNDNNVTAETIITITNTYHVSKTATLAYYNHDKH